MKRLFASRRRAHSSPRDDDDDDDARAMYGWERSRGEMPSHFVEKFTDADVDDALRRAKLALAPAADDLIEPAIADDDATASSSPSDDATAMTDDARPPVATSPPHPASSYETWTEAKADAVRAHGDGDFEGAAARFRAAIEMLLEMLRGKKENDDAEDDASASDADAGASNADADVSQGNAAVALAALRSNLSCALLAAGRPRDALAAASDALASRPAWDKALFRRAEANFALRRFEDALVDYDAASAARDPASPPDAHLLSRVAATRAMLDEVATLRDEEVALRAEREEDARRLEKQKEAEASESGDKASELTAAAEERERDPRVKALVKRIEEMYAAHGEARAARKEAWREGEGGGGETAAAYELADAGPPAAAAIKLCRDVLALEPDYTAIGYQLSMIYRSNGRLRDAIDQMRACLTTAPTFLLGHAALGQMLESTHGREDDAELSYAIAVQVCFDNGDVWSHLGAHLARRGRVSDAVALLRHSLCGGPEGKFYKPRCDPGVLMLLGYLLQLRGHSAEPVSFYMRASRAGGGVPAALLLARAFEDAGDAENADTQIEMVKRVRAEQPAATRLGYEVLNSAFAAPQWNALSTKKHVAALLRGEGVEGDVAPHCYWSEDDDVDEKEKEKKDDDDDDDDDDENDAVTTFAPGRWIVKGKNRAYDGATRARLRRCETKDELVAFVRDAGAAAGPGRERACMAQREVENPALLCGGRLASAHFYAIVADAREGPNGAVEMDARLSEGFTVRVARDPLDADVDAYVDDGEAFFATRNTLRGSRREITTAAAAAAWAAESNVDYAATTWPGVVRAVETTLRAFARATLATPLKDFDALSHFATFRAPKILEFVFVVDAASKPWLTEINASPSAMDGGEDAVVARAFDDAWAWLRDDDDDDAGARTTFAPLFATNE